MSPEQHLYTLQALPAHLASSEQSARLQQILTTFEFLQAKLETLGPQSLIEDYENTKAQNLRLVQSALRLSAHVLGGDPRQLSGQLLGRLLLFEAADIQSLLQLS